MKREYKSVLGLEKDLNSCVSKLTYPLKYVSSNLASKID
jgi:hypothetical protein